MLKPKMLLVNRNLIAGGIETSLISFVENMKNVADIEVMLFSNDGILKDKLPKDIKILEGGKILRQMYRDYQINPTSSGVGSKKSLQAIVKNILGKLGIKKLIKKFALVGQKNKSYYDIAICYNGMDNLCVNYVNKCVKAKKKINIIHSDIAHFDLTKKQIKNFNEFDKIICVSESCADVMRGKYPIFKDKIDYVYNFQNREEIIELSIKKEVEYKKGFNFVTVGRLAEEKAHIRTLNVLKKLKNQGYKFIWNIVGEGPTRNEIEKFISDNQMQDCVILHGNQKNPYPYIKASEFLWLGSYHEAAPMVYAEAMFLGVPVATTETRSAKELVGDKGFICDNSEEGIYFILKDILTNRNLLEEKKKELQQYNINADVIINKILNWSN